MEINHSINWDIKANRVRLVGQGSEPQIMSLRSAIELAEDQDMDLVMVDSKADIPVCKILDYGKMKYESRKNFKQKKSKEDKEIRIRHVINPKDLDVKIKHARALLTDGHRVVWTMRFRGRESEFVKIGVEMMRNIVESLSDVSRVEQDVKCDGNTVMAKVAPKAAPSRE
jgi:translation initiation factor IF-3